MARSGSDNVRAAWQFLIGKGLTPAQAAGVIGSMQGESGPGLNPGATNPNGGAYGIAQWLGGRKTALTKRADPGSLQTQLNYLWSELQGPERGSLKGLKAAHTPEGAAVAWQKLFERGAPFEQKYDQRAANARKVFDTLKGAGGGVQALMDASSGPKTAAAPSQGQDVGGGVDVAALLSAMGQQKPMIQSAGIAAPAFSARPSLPGGYASPQGGGGPAQSGPDVSQLLALVGAAGQGQGLPASQQAPAAPGQQASVPRASGLGAGGEVRIAPGANRAGVGLTPGILKVVRAVAAQAGGPLTVGTGTNHNRLTVDGNVSDHWSGNATDIPSSGDRLTKLGQNALIAAGMDPAQARQQHGGLFNLPYGKHRRIQVIFNTNQGGNHYNHLHVGVTAR